MKKDEPEEEFELVSDDELIIEDPEILEEVAKPADNVRPTILELTDDLFAIQGCLEIKLRRELGRRPKLADQWVQSQEVVCKKCGWLALINELTREWRCGRCNITVSETRLRLVHFVARHLYKAPAK